MVEVLSAYCMDCKEWVYDRNTHKCPKKYWVVADKEMVGIADRLFAMGITPMVALWTAVELGELKDYEYLLSLRIDIGERISEAILGELPKGWQYFWETVTPDKSELHMLALSERWFNFGFDGESVDDRIEELIREFEQYLDTRDSEAVKALLLLTTG
jgi:hypothetical protein